MVDVFFPLIGYEEIDRNSRIIFTRTGAILTAIERNRDFILCRVLRRTDSEGRHFDCIVTDVAAHGVPSNNPYGIEVPERIGLIVHENENDLVEVRPLRKTFPILPHQNAVSPDAPPSLCLYFEPAASVFRTWTPQKFLRRIQWWLEKSARDELHAADQPLEQLFFSSDIELVLPWNFNDLVKQPNQKFEIGHSYNRFDRALTLFVDVPSSESTSVKSVADYIECTLPPVATRSITSNPVTLGQLHEFLQDVGVDLLAPVREIVNKRVGANGIQVVEDNSYLVFLIHTPICRSIGQAPETIFRRAFVAFSSLNGLALKTGDLIELDNHYFRGAAILGDRPTEWRNMPICPMEVLYLNQPSDARLQSGIVGEGPAGVLIGAGSLGSAMLNFWTRGGWGLWTIIDKDHIRPHNLTRHTAFAHQIGIPKVFAVAELHDATVRGASLIKPVVADACDISAETVMKPLQNADLVVDASTTVEYPRLASLQNEIARHISVFVTPNGNGSVLLAEDEHRKIRLRTLEAQYYRALIQEPWGANHLNGHLGTFWSGASCRDVSVVLPYSRIMSHAALLTEQVQRASTQTGAVIRVWERDPVSGVSQLYQIEPRPEKTIENDGFSIFIDEGVLEQLHAIRKENLPKETGGVLVGYHDLNLNALVIVAALPAPVDSASSGVAFERGTDGLVESLSEVFRRTGGIVEYVGEWHSHPRGSSSRPSGADISQLEFLAQRMAEDGLPVVQLIVGENDIRIIPADAR